MITHVIYISVLTYPMQNSSASSVVETASSRKFLKNSLKKMLKYVPDAHSESWTEALVPWCSSVNYSYGPTDGTKSSQPAYETDLYNM